MAMFWGLAAHQAHPHSQGQLTRVVFLVDAALGSAGVVGFLELWKRSLGSRWEQRKRGDMSALRLAPCCCMTEFYGGIPQIFQVLSPQQGLRACGGSVLLCQELGEGGEAAAPTKTGRGGHTISSLLANKSNF